MASGDWVLPALGYPPRDGSGDSRAAAVALKSVPTLPGLLRLHRCYLQVALEPQKTSGGKTPGSPEPDRKEGTVRFRDPIIAGSLLSTLKLF